MEKNKKTLAYGIYTDLAVVNSNGQIYSIAHTNSDGEITINCDKKNQDFSYHASNVSYSGYLSIKVLIGT